MTDLTIAAKNDVDDYYADDAVRARILEYCGGSPTHPPTAAYLVTLGTDGVAQPSWDEGPRLAASDIASVWTRQGDIARSLWDSDHLLFLIELDYQNTDAPAEPFLHPADVFLKLEPAYQAAVTFFKSLSLPVRAVATGRGYHFVGQVPLDDPLVEVLAAILPGTPAWYAGVGARRPTGVTAPLSELQARAAAGLGCLIEYAAHLMLEHVTDQRVPVVFNGTVVGNAGAVGRECVSIDFSHVGDPLDVRHVRTAFSTYQWHRMRPDLFGSHAASAVRPLVALPRGRRSLVALLTDGRDLAAAGRTARHTRASLPNIAGGLRRLLNAYSASALAKFHRAFYAELRSDVARTRGVDPASLPPCVAAGLTRPNDLLLKPEHIQHLVRGLMSIGWRPAGIARLVQSAYEADHGWGDRWTARMDVRTRAEFDVRVFAGLVATGVDPLIDFNCVSAQEKDICPRVGCRYDLRVDRDRLAASRA